MTEQPPRRPGPSAKVAAIREAAAELRTRSAEERRELLERVPADQDIVVRRQWDGRLRATYRFADLGRLHLSDTSGGVGAQANRLYIHGYVQCDAMTAGELDHSCRHGPPPHRIKVCVVAVDNGGPRSSLMRSLRRLVELGPTPPDQGQAPPFAPELVVDQPPHLDMGEGR